MHRFKTVLSLLFVAVSPLSAQTSEVPPKVVTCVACHGPMGNSTQGTFPVVAGQTARYLYLELRDFKEGRRNDPVMSPMATDLTRDEMLALASYFSQQMVTPNGFKPDQARAAKGEKKAAETLCTSCHGGGFSGQNEIPKLAGQQADYIVKQLRDFKARKRTNDGGNMTSVAQTLSDDDMIDLAHYVSGL